jgi:hypothetical protein
MSSTPPQSGAVDRLDLWKHFAQTGGNDKDRMINICSWLLAFSVALAGLTFVQEVHPHLLSKRWTFVALAVFGFLTSLASALVALIYGGYANWNWAKADQIARLNEWKVLDPKNDPWTDEQKASSAGVLARCSRWLARPRETYSSLAPVVVFYIVLSLVLAASHVAIMMLACSVSENA